MDETCLVRYPDILENPDILEGSEGLESVVF